MQCLAFLLTFIITASMPVLAMDDPKAMSLSSAQVVNGNSFKDKQIFDQQGCTGENRSPQLQWINAPINTKSFGITMHDPDAPHDSDWWHWVVINIPAQVNFLMEDAGRDGSENLPKGASMMRNDFGFKAYGGPCPPQHSTPHHYRITVYALDVAMLDSNKLSTPAMASLYMQQHALAKAFLVAPTKTR